MSNQAGKRKRRSEEGQGNFNGDVDASRSGLISLNNLSYLLSPDLSVAVSRKHITSFAQQQTYSPSQKISIILNSGSQYIDPTNSFLKFTVTNLTDSAGTFGLGSAVNLIKRLVISLRVTFVSLLFLFLLVFTSLFNYCLLTFLLCCFSLEWR